MTFPKPVIALTMGEPGGIGPEVIAKALRSHRRSKKFDYLLMGARAPFELLKKKFHLSIPSDISFLEIHSPSPFVLGRSPLPLEGGEGKGEGEEIFDPGKISKRNAILAYESLRTASRLAIKGKVQAIVTAPLNKTGMRFVDAKFQGHTEYLASQAGVKEFAMMFVGPRLKVTLVTIHVPLKSVSPLITRQAVFEKIRLTHEFLKKYYRIKTPRIAVCALNPHGKETGTEDEAQIRPAVRVAQKKKILAHGPFSADQLFHEAYEGKWDAVISMYHDQGLAPFKMIAFRDGVNVTLGLPFIRTSPDHGTALGIAYQNKADASSFLAALRLAEKLLTTFPHLSPPPFQGGGKRRG